MRKNSSKQHGVNSLLNRSQSAMEYLMTYGWAILIIAIVLVALFSLGIFNSSNFSPRAQPGSCEVLRNSAQTSLVGQCNGMLPEYVAQFNGASSAVAIANVVGMPQVSPGSLGKITITAWALSFNSPVGVTQLNVVHYGGVATCGTSDNDLEVMLRGSNPNEAYTVIQCSNERMGGTATIAAGQWVFYATTFDGSNNIGDIGMNGQLYTGTIASGIANVILQASAPLAIGQSGPFDQYWNGYISNVQIYNASLSNSSIQALYKEGIGGAPINVNNLMGWWPLNGNANDYSGNDNNGVPTNLTYTSAWTSSYSAP